MANPCKTHHPHSKSPKPTPPSFPNPRNSSSSTCSSENEETNPPLPEPHSPPTPLSIDGSQQDTTLHLSEFLTRQEVLARRSRRVKQLARYYRNQYWALMEELRLKHRDYYWKYGKSPFKGGEEEPQVGGEHYGGLGLGLGMGDRANCSGNGVKRCSFAGCEAKAMALTSYCHPHILSDSKQKLYKACNYVVKSSQTGPVVCGKPVLRAAVPSFCTVHFQKAQKHVSQALKKAGFISLPGKPAPNFHVIIAEYVRQIQSKRREAQIEGVNNVVVKKENSS